MELATFCQVRAALGAKAGHRFERARRVADVARRGTDQSPGLLLLQHMRRPSRGTSRDEERGHHLVGDVGEVQKHGGPIVDIGLHPPLGIALGQLSDGGLLELEGDLVARRTEARGS